jgi:type II secretory pathway pseudopilin PulG
MSQGDIDHLRLDFDREKWRDEVRQRDRELAIREKEQQSHEHELDLKAREQNRTRWTNPLVLAVFAAAIAAAGNGFVAWLNNREQQEAELSRAQQARELDQSKSEADRILEMIKTNNDPDKAATNLKFLVDAGLITNSKTKEPLVTYLKNRKQGEGATLPSPTTSSTNLPPPTPTFTIECSLPASASVPEVQDTVRDFLKSPPFLIQQVQISDIGTTRYITWDPAQARLLANPLNLLFFFTPNNIEAIKILTKDGKLNVTASLPQRAGPFVFRQDVDQNAALTNLTNRLR